MIDDDDDADDFGIPGDFCLDDDLDGFGDFDASEDTLTDKDYTEEAP
jgi:hypothetical protein